MLFGPEILTIGFGATFIVALVVVTHPRSLVIVTWYVVKGGVGVTVTD